MTSLRQTIATPATPMIETIQNAVSMMRTMVALKPSQNEAEIQLTTAIVTEVRETDRSIFLIYMLLTFKG